MRRYTVIVDGTAFMIDIEETASDRFLVTVGERTFEASLETAEDLPGAVITPGMPPPAAGVSATPASPPPPADVASSATGEAPSHAATGGTKPRAAAGTAAASRGPDVTAPMPGVILEVHVKAGVAVRRGDPLLVLEAMKMRNTIRAPRDGVILEVTTEAGRPVAPGEPLVRLGDAPR